MTTADYPTTNQNTGGQSHYFFQPIPFRRQDKPVNPGAPGLPGNLEKRREVRRLGVWDYWQLFQGLVKPFVLSLQLCAMSDRDVLGFRSAVGCMPSYSAQVMLPFICSWLYPTFLGRRLTLASRFRFPVSRQTKRVLKPTTFWRLSE